MELASDPSVELASDALGRVRSFSIVSTSSESSHSEEVVFLCRAAEMRLTRVGFASFPTCGVFASSGARARRRGDVTTSELIERSSAAELGDSIAAFGWRPLGQTTIGQTTGGRFQRTTPCTTAWFHKTRKVASAVMPLTIAGSKFLG